ncbi:hypothetical protein ED733_005309 [Metarhizium rileyi]|uniref:Uncharacterized protein n=1 Tax=Metarhizium rileyi (strain RCEF 4871) TaxID=1649241 RepID=A0A5C6GC19_METRR|nr:hypothetical protein ED733_005309 [Metarhizium rileyi]
MQSGIISGVVASACPRPVDAAASEHAVQSDMTASSDQLMEKLVTTASSRDGDDLKGSDGWELDSDASTVSSRVTTPDPQPPPRSRPPLSSNTTEIPTFHVSRTPAIPIPVPGDLPPPPPPPRYRNSQYSQQVNQPHQVTQFSPTVQPASDDSTNDDTNVCPQSSLVDGFRCDRAPPPPLKHPFPQPFTTLAEHCKPNWGTISLPVTQVISEFQSESSKNVLSQKYPFSSITRSTVSSMQPHPPKGSDQGLDRTLRIMPWSEKSRESSSSEYTSEEDTFAYRNARQFPPQLPAQPNNQTSSRQKRSSATNRITKWVSEYEKSQSHARLPCQDTTTSASSKYHGSEAGASQLSPASSHAVVENLWQQLKQKRAKLHEMRKQMTRRRRELRQLRLRKDEADNAFMTVVRPLLLNQRNDALSSSLGIIDSRVAVMLKLREDYHFSEANYESLELALDEEEKELSGLETRFFSLLATGQDHHAEKSLSIRKGAADVAHSVDIETPYYLMGISADKPLEDIHPLYHQLSNAVGDLENAKEEHEYLMLLSSQYEEDQLLKARIGQSMSVDAQEFFAELPEEESRMQRAISELEGKVQRLKLLCEAKGAMKKFLSIHMSYILNPGTICEGVDLEDAANILKKHTSGMHSRYSQLLAQKNHLLDGLEHLTAKQALSALSELTDDDPFKDRKQQRVAAKEYEIETLIQSYDPDSKTDLINRWILQQLRESPLNALLLESVFSSECGLKIRDHWRWQCDVLYYWWRDDTLKLGEMSYKNHVSEITEYSACQRSPQGSRAAYDGGKYAKSMRKNTTTIQKQRNVAIHLTTSHAQGTTYCLN